MNGSVSHLVLVLDKNSRRLIRQQNNKLSRFGFAIFKFRWLLVKIPLCEADRMISQNHICLLHNKLAQYDT